MGGGGKSSSSSSWTDGRLPTTTTTASSSTSLFQFQPPSSRKKSQRQRKLKILTSSDPSAVHGALVDLDPATTAVISINIDPEWEDECCEITSIVKAWLFSGLASLSSSSSSSSSEEEKRRGHILRHHLYYVTVSNDASRPSLSVVSSSSDPNMFTLPRHSRCEAYSMFSAAGLLVSGGSIREMIHSIFLPFCSHWN